MGDFGQGLGDLGPLDDRIIESLRAKLGPHLLGECQKLLTHINSLLSFHQLVNAGQAHGVLSSVVVGGDVEMCHRSLQNQPAGVESKPAT